MVQIKSEGSRLVTFCVFSFVGVFLTSEASATSLMPENISANVSDSQVVFRAQVLESSSRPAEGIFWTELEVKILDIYKSHESLGSTFTIKIPGGQQAGGDRIVVNGVPEFKQGAEYIFFAAANGILRDWRAYRVTEDAQTGERFVLRQEFHARQDRTSFTAANAQVAGAEQLDDFVTEIFRSMN